MTSYSVCTPTPVFSLCQSGEERTYVFDIRVLNFEATLNTSTKTMDVIAALCLPVYGVGQICGGASMSQESGFELFGRIGSNISVLDACYDFTASPAKIFDDVKNMIMGVNSGDAMPVAGGGASASPNLPDASIRQPIATNTQPISSSLVVDYDLLHIIMMDGALNRGNGIPEEMRYRKDNTWSYVDGLIHTNCCETGKNGHNRIQLMETRTKCCSGCGREFLLEMFYLCE